MKVLLAHSPSWDELGDEFQKKYVKSVRLAYKQAVKLLPFGSDYVSFVVQPREKVLIGATHDYGRTHNSGFIELAFSPKYAMKYPDKIISRLRSLVLHEMNHAARFDIPIWHKTFLDLCVMEGLATVFEREYADFDGPWGKYPGQQVERWIQEIKKNEKNLSYDEYMYKHPDGRRWIGYKVGTYLIDEAIRNSGKTVIELTKLECQDILKLAKVL